jgi:phosphohistidine phosphatase
MKTLYLLRHAKSSWDDSSLKDFDRPLNERGLKAAPKMGAWMRKQKIRPDVVMSSPALRAKQTTTIVAEAAGLSGIMTFNEAIYEASSQKLFHLVASFENRVDSVLMVGHNPGFEELVAALTGENKRMPTAALAYIELDIAKWSDLTAGEGKLKWVTRPKELT